MREKTDIDEKIKFVKACRKLGATEVKFNDGTHVILDEKARPQQNQPSVRQARAIEEKANIIEDDSRLQQNADHIDDQLSMLLIEDPSKYEELLREGELKDGPPIGEAYN